MATEDYYGVFGLRHDAPAEEIKKIYGVFHQNGLDDNLINLLWRFSRMGAGSGWAGGCRGRGFGKRGCGRWKR